MKRRTFVRNTALTATGLALSSELVAKKQKSFGANDQINIGIIGTGSRGAGLIPIIEGIEGLQVVACCDVLPFRLNDALSKTAGRAKGFTDYRKLLEYNAVDAVLIATPFYLHQEVAMATMDADKHIYCEKTLVKGYTAIATLLKKAENFKKVFQTGHQYHSSRMYTQVVDLIKAGKVGKVTGFNCQWNRNGNWRRDLPDPSLEKAINWRMYREYSGGLVAELCSHQLDFVNWVNQSLPESALGVGGIDYWKDGRETFDNVHLIYSYPNGTKAKFTCLTSNAMDNYKVRVHGDKGTLILDYSKAWFYPEQGGEKKWGNVDGVSGATTNWQQGRGIPLNLVHEDPSKQALIDFRNAIWEGKIPASNLLTGAKAAVCVQMGLDAMYEEQKVLFKELPLSDKDLN